MTLTISSARPTDSDNYDRQVDDLIGDDDPAPVTAAERLLTGFGSSAQTLFVGLGRRDTVRDRGLPDIDAQRPSSALRS